MLSSAAAAHFILRRNKHAEEVEMFVVKWLTACALAFSAVTHCVKAAERNGQEFLQDILHFYGENKSITTEKFEDLLLLVSARRAESVTEDNPLEQKEV